MRFRNIKPFDLSFLDEGEEEKVIAQKAAEKYAKSLRERFLELYGE